LLLGSACGSQSEPAPAATEKVAVAAPAPAAAAPTESADDVFKNRCTPRHGASAKGDGPAAAALNPKPRNYTDLECSTD
jgi:cytochrome c5